MMAFDSPVYSGDQINGPFWPWKPMNQSQHRQWCSSGRC